MKIRIKGNALRYRLTRSDIDRLAVEGYLEERTAFPGNSLVYAVKLTDHEPLTSVFADQKIVLNMSRAMIEELIQTEKVGFSNQDGALQLLVEKDFTCLDNVDEDQSDHYPNPLAANIDEERK